MMSPALQYRPTRANKTSSPSTPSSVSYRGKGYEVSYDYGRLGEDLAAYRDQPGFTREVREVAGRAGEHVTFRGNGNPWEVVRIISVPDDRNQLTIRVSCADDETCRLADDVFDWVQFASSR